MTANKGKAIISNSPFPGIDPYSYSDHHIFFAREQDSRTLLRTIVIYRGTLLYSTSGFGKSSLINAGLLPRAIAEGFQVEKLRVQPKSNEEIIVERISEKSRNGSPFLPSIFSSNENEEHVVLSIDSFQNMVRRKSVSTRPLLIFDQFEEWFTLFEESGDGSQYKAAKVIQEKIRDTILSLLWDTKLPVKVLLVFREDYLAKLTPFFNRYPNLPDQYLRLESLKGTDIKRIIRGPFKEHPEIYEREISEALAEQIQGEFESRGGDEPVQLSEVQIVCRDLYESGKTGKELENYFQARNVQGILEHYLDSSLNSLQEEQQDPAIRLLSRMVTPVGTRNVISEDDLLSRVANDEKIQKELLKETLQNLENRTKLVRRERRREVYYYEIVSEFLVKWIQRKDLEKQESGKIKQLRREKEMVENDLIDARALTISYLSLRRLIGILGITFPFIMQFGAKVIFNVDIPESLSGYYYTGMHDVFIAFFVMFGILLFSYKGLEKSDDIVSNLGAIAAFGWALFPVSPSLAPISNPLINIIHLASLIFFILTNSYMSLFSFTRMGRGGIPHSRKIQRNIIYRVCGYIMLSCVLVIVINAFLPILVFRGSLHILESIAFVALGVSWFVKGEGMLKDYM